MHMDGVLRCIAHATWSVFWTSGAHPVQHIIRQPTGLLRFVSQTSHRDVRGNGTKTSVNLKEFQLKLYVGSVGPTEGTPPCTVVTTPAAKFPLSCAPRATFRMTSSALATGNPIAAAMASRSTAPGRQRVGPRRQAYSAEYKLKVVREALKRPPSNRIKPTCRDFPGIEPARSPHPPGVSISG